MGEVEILGEAVAEPGLEPGTEPGAPALDLVSCSPGQQLEGRKAGMGGEVAGDDGTDTV